MLLILVCLFNYAKAQQVNAVYFPKVKLAQVNNEAITQFLMSYFNDLQDDDIQLHPTFQRSTKVSSHYTYEILYKQIPLFQSCVKVNIDANGQVISIKKEHFDLALLKHYDPSVDINNWSTLDLNRMVADVWGNTRFINNSGFKIFNLNERPVVIAELNAWDKHQNNTLVLDLEGNKLFEYDNVRHANIDTIINVKVFNPDPLTALGFNYGGLYIDNNDVDDSWMSGAYFTTTVDATFDNANNTFYPENQYVKIEDFESPTFAPATSLTTDFFFNRSQSGFEDVNALYHITSFHNYISSLGYDSLMDLQVQVDPHAQFGADNSAFNKNGGNPTLVYGTGGVDDAEDADVIIHEYCHGVSWSANNNNTFSFERSALDEGLADYFAVSYSRAINPFNWQNVFNWDGPIWGGRTATTTNNYPVTGNYYKLGEVWNAAMSAIWTDLGQIVTDKLMLESLHFFTDNTTLPEAAMYVLQADTLLFGGVHSNTICSKFQGKQILDINCKPVGISETKAISGIQLINSLGFAKNEGNIQIIFPEVTSGNIELMDMSGKQINKEQFNACRTLEPQAMPLQPGIYFLNIYTPKGRYSFKLARY